VASLHNEVKKLSPCTNHTIMHMISPLQSTGGTSKHINIQAPKTP
jgi:hypothetical protein